MRGLDDFLAECDHGPRINELTGFFAATAAGESGMPIRKPVVDTRLLPSDDLLRGLVGLHAARQGFFDQHYHGSIPYRLEEECRMAYAMLKYARYCQTPLSLYSLGTAEGTMARTLSELSDGHIRSLSCSPNAENYKCFMAYGEPPDAEFFVGPFHRLTKEVLCSDVRLAKFASGFDFILEDTTFQMYSPNRVKQIEFVMQHLKEGGIFVFVEKFRAVDENDYARREWQKDLGFKARYFPQEEIEKKRTAVLATMFKNEVTLEEMSRVVGAHFNHCIITWNSGNFCSLAASNSRENLNLYLSQMADPAIPNEYVYENNLFRGLAFGAVEQEK
ncbi:MULTISPECIES: class I SAM-dependent methyltransferase [unclassified Mesorhizobium]|uniref:class I SAM-dependent methyltransferase n=1 Tax=unclassified Mesorhizobium TaxID=325217 RepID=UPI000FCB4179|nr:MULTISPECIES: class I SAM-dependent methyltransferase [unclassified Mesorhizobium]RUW36206.1 class I SAM-dependent methyltransferase [Mesorhizobium sp. M1E.F.Ca.ET.041.01.1.1]RUW85615.1 class I SAM-dependent methyltransferase [Mesorhizobium sp. M1E.F.Ca.ET.063.01.1.1]RWD89895.1 MAG: class I SAM-dependent methyltransferase [Mesorhizobium sp.]RWD93498.1 MAG: class I SAM-dependent methyltransferase [Mesorhizobium sp.]TIV55070.1 MAG: class I SAM-dependent methyltransferase [Mesorhizobium sp.]